MNREQPKNVIGSIHLKAKSSTNEEVPYINQLMKQQSSSSASKNLNLGISSAVHNDTPSTSLLRTELEHFNTKPTNTYTTDITIGSLLPFQAALPKDESNTIIKLPSFTNCFKTPSSHSFEALVNMPNFGNSTSPIQQYQFTSNDILKKNEFSKVNLQSTSFNDAHVDKITTQEPVDQNIKSISLYSKKQTSESSLNDSQCSQNNPNSKPTYKWQTVFQNNNINTTKVNKLNENKLLNKINEPNMLQQNRNKLNNKVQPSLLSQANKTTQHFSKKMPYNVSDSSAISTTDKVLTNGKKEQNLNCETSNISNVTEKFFKSHKTINVNESDEDRMSNELKVSKEKLQLKNTQINIQCARQVEAKKKNEEVHLFLNKVDERLKKKQKRNDEAIQLRINNLVQSNKMKVIKIVPNNVPFKSGSFTEIIPNIRNHNFEKQTMNIKNKNKLTSINENSSETPLTLVYKSNNDGEGFTSKHLTQWKNTTVPDDKAVPININATNNIKLSENPFYKVNNEQMQNKTNIDSNENLNEPVSGINKISFDVNSDHLTFKSRETDSSKTSINTLYESPTKKTKYAVYSTENIISSTKTKKEILIDAYNKLCDNENVLKIEKQIADMFLKSHRDIRKPILELKNIEMQINSGDILDFSDLENYFLLIVSNAIMYQEISLPVLEIISNLRLDIKNYFQLLQDSIDIDEFDQIEKQTKTNSTENLNFNYKDFNFDCKKGILNSLNEWINNSSDESSAEDSDEISLC